MTQRFSRSLGGLHCIDFVTLWPQEQFKGFENVLLVVGGQNSRRSASRSGSGWTGFAWLERGWHELRPRIIGGALNRILDLDSIIFQSAGSGTVDFNFGLFMDGHGCYQIAFRQSQITLGSHGLER